VTEPLFHRTLVLDETTLGAVRAIAAREGWQATYSGDAGYKEKLQLLWKIPSEGDEAVDIRYYEEHWGGCRCVGVFGSDETEVEALARILAVDLAVQSEDAVLTSLSDDATEARDLVDGLRTMVSFHYLGSLLGAEPGPLDPRITAALERTLAHPHRQVRLSALIAANQLWKLWPELFQPVIARKGKEVEHEFFVDAAIEIAAKGAA
jgi:hypothetical protein